MKTNNLKQALLLFTVSCMIFSCSEKGELLEEQKETVVENYAADFSNDAIITSDAKDSAGKAYSAWGLQYKDIDVNFIRVNNGSSPIVPDADFDTMISTINQYFRTRVWGIVLPFVEPPRLRFVKAEVHDLNAPNLFDLDNFGEITTLFANGSIYEAGMLNIYLVNSTYIADGLGAGWGPMNDSRSIIETEDFLHLGSLVAHEIGHNLGLYHTFSTEFGAECANYSNSSTAGDGILDTPADNIEIFDSGSWDCGVNPTDIFDPCGDLYNVPYSNVMNWYGPCHAGFTYLQMQKMCQVASSLGLIDGTTSSSTTF